MNATHPLPTADIIASVEALWGLPWQTAGCPACGQAFVVDAGRLRGACPACARGNLAPQPARLRPEPPELLVPFARQKADLLPIFTRFTSGVWLHSDDFNPAALLNRSVPVYVPVWLVDSDLSGPWQAEVGFDYQVKSSQDAFRENQWHSREVVETRVRWEPRLGYLERHYDNIAVPALSGYTDLVQKVGEFHTDRSQAYDQAAASQAVLQVPDQQPESVWPQAQSNLAGAAALECQQAAVAQHIRNFRLEAAYRGVHWTQMLLPVYISHYTDDEGQPQMVFINGQTGQIGGLRLASQRKGWFWGGILAGAGIGLFLLGLLALLLAALAPPLGVLAIAFIAAGILVALSALIPVIWPWQWNRHQQERRVVSK